MITGAAGGIPNDGGFYSDFAPLILVFGSIILILKSKCSCFLKDGFDRIVGLLLSDIWKSSLEFSLDRNIELTM